MIELLKKLIRAEPTAQKGELQAAQILAEQFKRAGIAAEVDRWDDRRANCIAQVKSTGRKPALLFLAHLDVVPPGEQPWKHPPFEPTEAEGRIYGRGAADMKAGLTALTTAVCRIIQQKIALKGDLIILAAAGEETDSSGVKRFLARNAGSPGLPPLAGIVIPEPTSFNVVAAHRGILWLKVTTKGKTAHGSAPHLGINAITLMSHLLSRLESFQIPHQPHPRLGRCTMSVTKIAGGTATNIIPDACSIEIDIRTLPNQNHQAVVQQVFPQLFAELKSQDPRFIADLIALRDASALETDPQCGFVKDFCRAVGVAETISVGWTTDGPHLVPLGAPIVIFGPGDPEVCHKPDEYIDIADLEKAADLYEKIILAFLT
jgi:succinyl-diaminopimelate desuccinylase